MRLYLSKMIYECTKRVLKMAKFIVCTTWYNEKGLRPRDEMREGMRKTVAPYLRNLADPARTLLCRKPKRGLRYEIIALDLIRDISLENAA